MSSPVFIQPDQVLTSDRRLNRVKGTAPVGAALLGALPSSSITAGSCCKSRPDPYSRGARVSVVEGFGWLLPRQLAEPAGRMLQRHIEGLGMAVRCGVQVKEIVGDEAVRGVLMADGEEIPADLVVVSAGVRPNSHLARQSGIDVHTGIVVDDRMRTSAPAILAAGDVAEHRGILYGIWPASYAQGMVAGSNAVGDDACFTGLAPSNRLKVLDIDLFSIGEIEPTDASFQVIDQQQGETYRRLVCRDGCLVGAILYGDTRLAGQVGQAIASGTQLAQLAWFHDEIPWLADSFQTGGRRAG